ncbi:DUF4129 domain-containing transglutaminase family protein [Thalassobacillus pellis]|uniref:DUF4129 domain-containing transglutaminase family protein n=1 Tax=Thalassobacillus pellis TaxID=748008 RepID=UPI001EF992FD|nr:transglutaminase domain-containing protein [Thalassobacillus pellis]MBM7553393.1 transglutaminase-like putative cysteine protease [Thalassobacillus pellis]
MMQGLSQDHKQFYYQLVIYLCGFLLFWEWLRPLEKITDTENIGIFIIFAAFCFFISALQISWWMGMPLKLIGLIFILDGLFIYNSLFSLDWFIVVYRQLVYNFQMIQAQNWWGMTPFFRSLLFLLLLWLMSYLLYYWFVVAKRLFVFVLMTFIFITVVDTFTVYDGKWAIVRIFIISLVALGITNFSKEMETEEIPLKGVSKIRRLILPLFGMILLSTIVGYAAPKPDPKWADPVPYIENAIGGGGKVVQKVGYGEDDTRLGGSFIQDETPVFQAAAQGERYWRIESKNHYTGKGWENTLEPEIEIVQDGNLNLKTYEKEVKTEERYTIVNFTPDANIDKLVYPYGAGDLESYPEQFELHSNQTNGMVETFVGNNPRQIPGYKMKFDDPSFEYDQLRNADGEDPDYIKDVYLQLPETLPNRVRNLAAQITEGEENRYDAAKAVESYFSANGFEYATKDVPVPEENQDYVDQFLFESQRGYCDNFSTSMVVLLRAADIPARWVKGFTGGERTEETVILDDDETYNFYQVTNGNAHSWVEVYFPEVGWVPFEPTQGFSNPTDFYIDFEESGNTNSEETAPQPETENEQSTGQPENFMEDMEEASGGMSAANDESNRWFYIGIITAVLLVGLILYVTRLRWISAYLLKKYKRQTDSGTYHQAYNHLLKVLDKKVLARKSNVTLREYARAIDQHFQSNEMRVLTHHYERALYRNEDQPEQWKKVTELWENLIRKALS